MILFLTMRLKLLPLPTSRSHHSLFQFVLVSVLSRSSSSFVMPVTTRRRVAALAGQTRLTTTTTAADAAPAIHSAVSRKRTRSSKPILMMMASASNNDNNIVDVHPQPNDDNDDDVVSKDSPKTKTAKRTATPAVVPSSSSSSAPRTPSPRRRKRRPVLEVGSRDPPPDFERVYGLVEELRQDRTAPVDSQGADALPQRHRGDVVFRFQVLVALMLSSQTKDQVVGETMRILQRHGLDIDTIAATPPEVLNQRIGKVGFHNNKTKYILATVQILLKEYGGDIPRTAHEMQQHLPGVGPKMAFLVENLAWGTVSGIGVDTHMHRMLNQLQWVGRTKTPEQTRIALESWLPRSYWKDINHLWVGLGQEIQQSPGQLLHKALYQCSDPPAAIQLLQRLGLDWKKHAKTDGMKDQIQKILDEHQKTKQDPTTTMGARTRTTNHPPQRQTTADWNNNNRS